ncbi:MAG: putative cation-transporting ATPase F [candidate division WS6 bacterium OLB20]|uniref:Putative cation-transporting ATPase F n=1 Tax=candidate division WS6 bacterium OLB20 TaxID=1617426 RepID=A0A136LXU4_9BACT|nr:MAG: putative cation-transporting ATPase F [candidate division WS6 bacterium OLB20]
MTHSGLTRDQALERMEKYGPNRITDPERLSVLELTLNQFKSPLIFILFLAAGFSLLLDEYTDAFFILLVVLINAALGFYQEYKAENILSTLKQKVSKNIKVIRDGKRIQIGVEALVPGDVFVIEPGLKVPADAVVLEGDELHANEAILTGESEPVAKESAADPAHPDKASDESKLYMGTSVTEGIGLARVYATGDNTEFGKIAASLESKFDPPTPIKQELMRISRLILAGVVLISFIVFLLGILQGLAFEEIFLTSVALGVSTIPEGLIISLTVTLALGMNRIMKRKAIVRNLPAAETLGAVDVLGIDKTGTLTEGRMSVIDTEFKDHVLAHRAIAICNNDANFIDHALASYVSTANDDSYLAETLEERRQLFPFSSQQKYTGAYDGSTLYAVELRKKYSVSAVILMKPGTRGWMKRLAKATGLLQLLQSR